MSSGDRAASCSRVVRLAASQVCHGSGLATRIILRSFGTRDNRSGSYLSKDLGSRVITRGCQPVVGRCLTNRSDLWAPAFPSGGKKYAIIKTDFTVLLVVEEGCMDWLS